jgi:hypothetical protein
MGRARLVGGGAPAASGCWPRARVTSLGAMLRTALGGWSSGRSCISSGRTPSSQVRPAWWGSAVGPATDVGRRRRRRTRRPGRTRHRHVVLRLAAHGHSRRRRRAERPCGTTGRAFRRQSDHRKQGWTEDRWPDKGMACAHRLPRAHRHQPGGNPLRTYATGQGPGLRSSRRHPLRRRPGRRPHPPHNRQPPVAVHRCVRSPHCASDPADRTRCCPVLARGCGGSSRHRAGSEDLLISCCCSHDAHHDAVTPPPPNSPQVRPSRAAVGQESPGTDLRPRRQPASALARRAACADVRSVYRGFVAGGWVDA